MPVRLWQNNPFSQMDEIREMELQTTADSKLPRERPREGAGVRTLTHKHKENKRQYIII